MPPADPGESALSDSTRRGSLQTWYARVDRHDHANTRLISMVVVFRAYGETDAMARMQNVLASLDLTGKAGVTQLRRDEGARL